MSRKILSTLAAAVIGLAVAASAGCVHCSDYPPGTKISAAGGGAAFQGKPTKGGAETRPSS